MSKLKKIGEKTFRVYKDSDGFEIFHEVQVLPNTTFAKAMRLKDTWQNESRKSFYWFGLLMVLMLVVGASFMWGNPDDESITKGFWYMIGIGVFSLLYVTAADWFPRRRMDKYFKEHDIKDLKKTIPESEKP